MSKFDLGLIIPSYGHFDYVESAVRSAFANTSAALRVLVVDDASPDWEFAGSSLCARLQKEYHEAFRVIRYVENGGLTRSWNGGLNYFNSPEARTEYICCGNSDLIFGPYWDVPLCLAAKTYNLVGPLSNAPGTCQHQDVAKWLRPYEASDDAEAIAATAEQLRRSFGGAVETVNAVNGFCLFASRESWFSGAYEPEAVFRPRNDFNSKGHRNPTPLMTLNEDELQARWRREGWPIGVCLGSFVFHYRSVSRGDRYAKGAWVRKK